MAEPVVQLSPFQYQRFWLNVALVCGLAYFVLLGVELYLVVTKPILEAIGR
jgi:NhaP-type Na+/H+ or K+/H+ antiporter